MRYCYQPDLCLLYISKKCGRSALNLHPHPHPKQSFKSRFFLRVALHFGNRLKLEEMIGQVSITHYLCFKGQMLALTTGTRLPSPPKSYHYLYQQSDVAYLSSTSSVIEADVVVPLVIPLVAARLSLRLAGSLRIPFWSPQDQVNSFKVLH